MKTSHIKHVVLYAKNFYRHTGDILKDLQRFMQMDGVPYKKINTPEKALAVMRKNYLEWVDSLGEDYSHDINYLRKDADCKVGWERDEVRAKLWHFMCIYSNAYIPMNGKTIGYPKYDKYHMPQFDTKENLFKRNGSFEDWNKAAKDFLDITLEDRCDEYMNNLMEKYQFEEVSQIFTAIGEYISAKDLSDELWDLYTKFMDENAPGDGTVKNGLFELYSDHFSLTINTKNDFVDIQVETLFNEATYTSPKEAGIEALKELFEMIAHDNYLPDTYIDVCKKHNEVFTDDFYISKHDEDTITVEHFSKSVMELYHEFEHNYANLYTDLINKKHLNIGHWPLWFDITIREDNTISITARFTDVFGCAVMEQELWPDGLCISEPKY